MLKNVKPLTLAYIQLHIAVVLFGFTAILGDLITLQATPLVWWRVLFASLSMVFLVRISTLVKDLGWNTIVKFAGIGVVTALHWVTFYASIKYANASIALVCLATTSFFTSFIEPILLKEAFKKLDISLGLVIIPAMVLIVSNLDFSMMTGVYLGIISAILASIFVTFNKKMIDKASPMRITFIEMTSATLFLSICIPLFYVVPQDMTPRGSDMLYLVILALLCTTLAQYFSMASLKHISAFNSVLVVNLEPVYGILLAAAILKEYQELTTTFYLGAGLIILTVFTYPLLKKLTFFQ